MDLGQLGHYLGVAIGFVAVTLVFGMAATGIAMVLAWLCKVRGRATRSAIKKLLVIDMDLRPHEAARFADELVRMRSAAEPESTLIGRVLYRGRRFLAWVEGPRDWLISAERLKDVIAAPEQHRRLQVRVARRYASMMSALFAASALLVATALQLSAPDLFRALSVDSTLKARVMELNQRLQQAEAAAKGPPKTYRNVSEQVLSELQQALPKLSDKFEQVSGMAVDKADALAELSLILEGHPDKAKALKRYEQLIDRALKGPEQAIAQAPELRKSDLATVDIRFWGEGSGFYYDAASQKPRWDNIVGVLIMSILLTFIAGFWHSQLARVGAFGYALKRPRKARERAATDRA